MASVTVNLSFAFNNLSLTSSSSSSSTTRVSSHSSLRFPLLNTNSLKLHWSTNISASILLPQKPSILLPSKLRTLTVVSAKKGYKMKTHKASAKRFRVTGAGRIVRRRAGKQHLLYKKNSRRKLRLSKMHPVSKSDYNNVIGALPYLKANRKGNRSPLCKTEQAELEASQQQE
ncbi:hypothetical protein TanjilG_09492 [Lupinus angustifolius]|uniref:50S ribosomal protein L35 n=1 Tax=Lupinus angustifolius TaxID=3871 RepID=A0A4P1RWR5_LUPAN|nr:PREDICTED: 50S ribosomal protein L35, chloroplastic [Lupinus angustifolius]OIW19472.1 hypothetical protein TanjilG_09492 [Lupinus angustifolius]